MTDIEANLPLAFQRIAERMDALHTHESLMKGLSFQPRSDDVILTAGIKTGTTWVMQILHALRSRGNMDFQEINLVVPLIEFYYDMCKEGDNLEDEQPFGPPRFFKCHAPYDFVPKGAGKYIVMTRDPKDAAVSFYHFYCNWLFTADEVSLEEFVEWMVVRDRPNAAMAANAFQMHQLASWYPHYKDANVLWLHYEDLKADVAQCIKLISDFIGVGVGDQALLDLVEKQSSLTFMKQYPSKFDIHPIKYARNEAMGLPRDCGIQNNPGMVRKGAVNEGIETLSKEMNAKLDAKWKRLLEPATGYGSYSEMRAAINKEFGRRF